MSENILTVIKFVRKQEYTSWTLDFVFATKWTNSVSKSEVYLSSIIWKFIIPVWPQHHKVLQLCRS